jgi:hypothetical protein
MTTTSPLGVALPFYSWKNRLQACTAYPHGG